MVHIGPGSRRHLRDGAGALFFSPASPRDARQEEGDAGAEANGQENLETPLETPGWWDLKMMIS